MLNKGTTKKKLTRKEVRDLDIEISFMEGIVKRDPEYIEAWRVLSDDYHRRGAPDLKLHVRIDEQLARLNPNDPTVLYALACSHALVGNIKESVSALRRTIAKGFSDFRWILKDPDLASVRKDPLFKKMWVKICALQPDA